MDNNNNSQIEIELYDLINKGLPRNAINIIREKYNINLTKKLGSGAEGVAYLTSDNNVLKITSNEGATFTAHHMIGKKFKHLANIYKIYKFPFVDEDEQPYYGILQELIKTDYSKVEYFKKFGYYMTKVFNAITNSNKYGGTFISEISNMEPNVRHELLSKVYKFIKNDETIGENNRLYLDTVVQMSEMADEMDTIPDVEDDFNLGNIGFNQYGNLTMFDLDSNSWEAPSNITYESKRVVKLSEAQIKFLLNV